jgi:hypothetical protein
MSLSLSSIAVLLSSLALCGASLIVPTAIATTPNSMSPKSTVPIPNVTPSRPATPMPQPFLLKITYAGGNRRSNGQPPEFIIRTDGVSFYRFMGKETPHRVLGPREFARLNQRLTATNFTQIKSRSFTGTCPTAYDGNELIYSFQLKSGDSEELSSCKVIIPGNSLLFQQLARLSQSAMSEWK